MAEDNADEVIKNEDEELQGGMQAGHHEEELPPHRPKCNMRIEELARPKKWLMLGTWRDFHAVFDPERMQRFKLKVQEEFSMSPEETELYFSQLRKHVRKMRSKKAVEKQLKREKLMAKQEAYNLFKKRIRRALRFAFEHQPPVIVSPMLRDLSDNILEKLADLHKVDIPKRDSTDKNSIFLICVADWAAKVISNIYYQVEAYETEDIAQKDVPSKISVCHSSVSGEEEEVLEEVEQEEEGEDGEKKVEGEEGKEGGEEDFLGTYE